MRVLCLTSLLFITACQSAAQQPQIELSPTKKVTTTGIVAQLTPLSWAAQKEINNPGSCPQEQLQGCREWIKYKAEIASPLRNSAAIVFLIDKSRSMEMLLAFVRQSALVAMNSLRASDDISVVAFDAAPLIVIPLQKVSEAKKLAKKRLGSIIATGKTDLTPALFLAQRNLLKMDSQFKHIIIFSDFKFPLPPEFLNPTLRELKDAGISVSTIVLGEDSDMPLAAFIAKATGGSINVVANIENLDRAVLEDLSTKLVAKKRKSH